MIFEDDRVKFVLVFNVMPIL